MARRKRWEEYDIVDGVQDVYISNWKYFSTYIQEELLDYDDYIYRGQACDKWLLESTLSRSVKSNDEFRIDIHLDEFKLASRGRRGPFPDYIEEDDDWWALGQHYGLLTPLLDWTLSPFVASYFAFNEFRPKSDKYRVVYALHCSSVDSKYHEKLKLYKKYNGKERTKRIEKLVSLVEPYFDQNNRLVSQRGLFTKLPLDMDLEKWVRKEFKDHSEGVILMKIYLPNKDRDVVLRQLNRMNINPLTLFPDLIGASEYCNNKALMKSY